MGNIANKRGGHGGRNAPPQIYVGFGDFEDGPDADPMGAVADCVKFFILLVFLGLAWWIWDLLKGKK